MTAFSNVYPNVSNELEKIRSQLPKAVLWITLDNFYDMFYDILLLQSLLTTSSYLFSMIFLRGSLITQSTENDVCYLYGTFPTVWTIVGFTVSRYSN
jgi:hypothetical protein